MPKSKVTFEDVGVTVSVPAGTGLIKVVSGYEFIVAPSALEDQVLKDNLAPRHHRLACQAQVLVGSVVVKPA